MRLRKKHKEQTELHTGPLNDILFILLFFFLLASLFSTINALKVNLPKSDFGERIDANKKTLTVTVDTTNIVVVSHEKMPAQQVSIEKLNDKINEIYKTDTNRKTIVFNGDIKTKLGFLVEIMNSAKRNNLKISVGTIKN